jgi:hypothetical protein
MVSRLSARSFSSVVSGMALLHQVVPPSTPPSDPSWRPRKGRVFHSPTASSRVSRSGRIIAVPMMLPTSMMTHLKPTELLLAHRHDRHGAPSGTPKPSGVSPLLCTGVSSLYCAYIKSAGNGLYGKSGDLRRRMFGEQHTPTELMNKPHIHNSR